jgi:hypothetical protein
VVRALLLLLLPLAAFGAPPGLIIESELSPARVYVGAEALLKLRLLRAPWMPHGTLRPPALGDAAEVSLLGSIRTGTQIRDGVQYELVERTHVIVPRRAGRLEIPGPVWEASLGFEVYNKATGTVPKTARGAGKVLEVREVPAGAGEPFLPAKSLVLTESWSRDLEALSEGIPVTRTLTLRAEGLAAERLPRIEMSGGPALLVHHDQPELKTEYFDGGMLGVRVQRIVLMPIGAGEVALPEVSVQWWDVGADAAKVATVPGRNLALHALVAPVGKAPREESVGVPALLRWGLLALLALAALALGWLAGTRAQRAARNALRAACRANDARGARDALLRWGNAVGAPAALAQSIGALQPVRAELAVLDAALYGGRDWDGAAFWKAVRPRLRRPARRTGAAPRALRDWRAPPAGGYGR